MNFKHQYGPETLPQDAIVNRRTAVRAVILRGGKLLMVHNNTGDYKFPGGGVEFPGGGMEASETMEDALRREVLEETGYIVTAVGEKIGEATENKKDSYEPNKYFSMTSHYFLCEVGECVGVQQLDDYEKDLCFTPVWISVADALANNEKIIERPCTDSLAMTINPNWVTRETNVLRLL
jgi:8-oxo-dGTP pyrophosphatase MutT (NUDIX family)